MVAIVFRFDWKRSSRANLIWVSRAWGPLFRMTKFSQKFSNKWVDITCSLEVNVKPLYVLLFDLAIYYHHQIGSINLTDYHIFPWLCAWDVCYIIFCHLLHIHSGKTVLLFSLLLCSLWWVQIFGYVLACRSCSFVCTLHHLIIIIVQTYLRTLNL